MQSLLGSNFCRRDPEPIMNGYLGEARRGWDQIRLMLGCVEKRYSSGSVLVRRFRSTEEVEFWSFTRSSEIECTCNLLSIFFQFLETTSAYFNMEITQTVRNSMFNVVTDKAEDTNTQE